jgi:hypothetical protein
MSGLQIDPADNGFRPGVQKMDPVHCQLIALINAMAEADQARFLEPARFADHAVTMNSALAAHLSANPGS